MGERIILDKEQVRWFEVLARDELQAVLASDKMTWHPDCGLVVDIADHRIYNPRMGNYVGTVTFEPAEVADYLGTRGLNASEIKFYLSSMAYKEVGVEDIKTEHYWYLRSTKKQGVDDYAKKVYNDYMDNTGYATQLMKVAKQKKEGKRIRSVDSYSDSYWKKVFKEMGIPADVLKSAGEAIGKVLDDEDTYSPAEYRTAYYKLAAEYKDYGGLNFVRRMRQELLRNRCKEHGIGSVIVHRSSDSDKVGFSKDVCGCYHYLDKDVGIMHIHSRDELKRISKDLEPFESDVMTPEDW